MQFSSVASFDKRKPTDAILVPVWQGKEGAELAAPLAYELVSKPLELGDFKGREEEILPLYLSGTKEPRAILVGLGKREEASAQSVRLSYGAALRCSALKLKSINVLFPEKGASNISHPKIIHAAVEGMLLANDAFDELKSDAIKKSPTVLVEKAALIGISAKILEEVEQLQKTFVGVKLARDLVNGNAKDVTPERLVQEAKDLAQQFKSIKTTVFDRKRIQKEKMGLFLAVNEGSALEPAFIMIDYQGAPRSKERSVIIGKGITFDTGGLNLKPTGHMETMKIDMAGAAAVLGTLHVLALLGLKINVTGIIATTDNSIGSRAYKPGDVYQGYSGMSVEISNTDAEGRLTLADALAYAVKNLSPTRMIDLATLTGAVVVALGDQVAGLMSNDDQLAKEISDAAQISGEQVWRLPMPKAYRSLLKSSIADIKNSGERTAGAITAAIFLKEFVGNVPWAHLDIAGTAYLNKPSCLAPFQATGFGVRLLTEFFKGLSR